MRAMTIAPKRMYAAAITPRKSTMLHDGAGGDAGSPQILGIFVEQFEISRRAQNFDLVLAPVVLLRAQ